MLLGTVLLWALNITVTRYILTHGFRPLAYATVRYGAAAVIFAAITIVAERTLRIARRDLPLVGVAALALFANQLCFVYAVKTSTASVVALVLGATPIFAALLGLALGTERLSRRFWLGAAISFSGVGLVAAGSGGHLRRSRRHPARRRHRRHLGRLLGRDHAADAPLLALAHQLDRARTRLGRHGTVGDRPDERARTTGSAGASGGCSSSRRSARSC